MVLLQTQKVKTTLKRKNKVGRFMTLNFKTYYIFTLTGKVMYWCKGR